MPVLSKVTWETEASRSRASPSRTRKPCLVALPMAAMMAVGVASTRAQGQNTTRMVTARMGSRVMRPGQGGGGQGRHYDPGGPAVCQPHDPGLAGIGGLDQPDHPLDRTVLPHLRRPHLEGAELVHRAAGNLVPGPLVHRQGLAGHHRLVDGGLSGENLSVHWHGLARQHPEHVAHSAPARREWPPPGRR